MSKIRDEIYADLRDKLLTKNDLDFLLDELTELYNKYDELFE